GRAGRVRGSGRILPIYGRDGVPLGHGWHVRTRPELLLVPRSEDTEILLCAVGPGPFVRTVSLHRHAAAAREPQHPRAVGGTPALPRAGIPRGALPETIPGEDEGIQQHHFRTATLCGPGGRNRRGHSSRGEGGIRGKAGAAGAGGGW